MDVYPIGQAFSAKSKVRDYAIDYIYRGELPNGRHYIEAASGKKIDDCEVDILWFDNREINLTAPINHYLT